MMKRHNRATVRTFVAVEISQSLKDDFKDIQESLKKEGLFLRWVKPQDIHLTMKFLGEIDKDLLPQIDKTVGEVCERNEIFSINLKGVGSFLRRGSSGVVWIGIDEMPSLTVLHSHLEGALEKIGFTQEARFTPHLTLGRIKLVEDRVHFRQIIEKYCDLDCGTMMVTALSLMKSDLKPEGPVYTRLSQFPLMRRYNGRQRQA
jgi:2'-5' RNA ligase